MLKDLISVIVPCYNQAQFLDECLQSVLDQTYEDWECLIINDGSPDNTEEVAEKWVEKDSRFKYYFKENGGLSSARNYGIERAEGSWLLPLDADDYISNEYLGLAQKHINDKNVKVIYCNAMKFGEIKGKWLLPDFKLENLARDNVIFCSAFFRKCDWIRVEGYDENLRIGLEDWDFWISILKSGGRVIKIENVCFFYRIKKNSMITNLKNDNNYQSAIKYVEKKHIDFFHQYFGSLHYLNQQNVESNKVLDAINKRFFSRVVNKLYSLKENFYNNSNF